MIQRPIHSSSQEDMSQPEISLTFDDVSEAEAGQHAAALAEELRRAVPDVQVSMRRTNPSAQDAGTVLGIVLGAPSVVILARALHAYMTRKGVRVRVIAEGRTVEIKDLSSGDVARVLEAAVRGQAPKG
jgi:hypothetical protein